MLNRAFVAFVLPSVLAMVGCGGSAPAPETPAAETSHAPSSEIATSPSETAAPATFGEQVTLGAQLYGKNCAECHGASGEGTPGPRLVGLDKGALPLYPPPTAKARKTQFKTVADIATFVVTSMPPKAPGSLKDEEYWAILAFDLKANGIDLGEKKLDAALAKTLEVPRK
jgi:mono/diheme cytochrome c family protein